MTTASIQPVRRGVLLLICLMLFCLLPVPLPHPRAALAQGGYAVPATAPDATPAALSPSGAIGLSYAASLGGDTAAAASIGDGQSLLFSRAADLGSIRMSPSSIQRLHTDERIQDIAAGPEALYLAIGQGGLLITTRDAAQRLGTLRAPGLAAAGQGGGLQVVDVANPAAPLLLAAVATGGAAQGATPDSDTLLVADGDGGLLRLRVIALPYQTYLPTVAR